VNDPSPHDPSTPMPDDAPDGATPGATPNAPPEATSEAASEAASDATPSGAIAVTVFLAATILVFWFGMYFLNLAWSG